MEIEQKSFLETTSMMQGTRQTLNILCCMCGISFNPSETKTNICGQCLASRSDATHGITKQGVLNFCRSCRRYNRPPWIYMERESKELLSFCLKKIRGLGKQNQLVDANFVWTEPHSRRIKIRLTIQKQVMGNASIQQSFEVEFVEHYTQCDDCKKEFTPHTWVAKVQVRQRVAHKRTFYYIEQLILKNNAHSHLLKIEEKDEGLDFFFKNKMHAQRLVDYLQTILPMKIKPSKQLISYDEQNHIYNTKYSWSVEIPRICKDDLVIIPPRLAKELGGVCQLLLCIKLTNTIRLLDPKSMKRIELTPDRYFHYESDLQIITLKQNSEEFIVNDYSKQHDTNLNESYQSSISNIFIDKIYDINVARVSDWQVFDVKTHLGNKIRNGATLIGYDMTKINYEEIDKLKNIPEIIIVKRSYDRAKRNKRIYELKRVEDEGVLVEQAGDEFRKKKSQKNNKAEEDFEEFMDEIDQNPDMQKNVRMYKNEQNIKKLTQQQLQRRNKAKKEKQSRKIVIVKNLKKNKDVNIFNDPIPENEEFDDAENYGKQQQQQNIQDQDSIKGPKNKKIGVKQKFKNQEDAKKQKHDKTINDDNEDDDDESDYEDFEVKLYQLEDAFAQLNIDDEENEEELENEETQNQKFIDDFVSGLDKFQQDLDQDKQKEESKK